MTHPSSPPPSRVRGSLNRLLAALAATFLATGCVFVRVEGEIPEGEWLTDVVHGDTEPAGFRHGKTEVFLTASLIHKRADIEMDFDCEPGEVDAYFDGVCRTVEATLHDERDAHITRVSSESPRQRVIEYDGEDGRGKADVRVVERDGAYTYRLKIRWSE